MGAGGRGSRPSPPQRAVIRNVLTNPYLWGKGNRGGDDGGVRVRVVGGDQGGGGEGGGQH